MIRRSLIAFFTKHKDDLDLNLTDAEKSEIKKFIKSNRFHFILRNQIVMNPIPKRLKKEENEQERGHHEYHSLNIFLERVSHILQLIQYHTELQSMTHQLINDLIQMISKTALDGEGIFQLGLIQDFFKKMKIPLSNVKVIGEYFDLDLRFRDSSNFDTHFQRFHNFIVNWRLCPAVGIRIRFNKHPDPAPHSVVIDSLAGFDDYGDPYYKCKNTDKKDKKIKVGFSKDTYPIYEAILIQFKKI